MNYMCQLCGYIYEADKEAVAFEDLPQDWVCPLCQAPKSMFKAQEARAKQTEPAAVQQGASALADAPNQVIDADGDVLTRLSAGQLAALCGNLARGCEKQAKPNESTLFKQLADYFETQVEPIADANVQALADLLMEDTSERYAAARVIAQDASDRGALRILTWGERVTNMLKYLVDRYLKEGDAFLAGTEIWVCTVCGFIYLGDEAPELCPVCKVPAWKFTKMERRIA